MNLIEELFTAIAISLCMMPGAAAFLFLVRVFKFFSARQYNACTSMPYPDDATESGREIGRFLSKLAGERKTEIIDGLRSRGFDYGTLLGLFGGYCDMFNEYIRYMHALGCELKIEKVSDEDIEEAYVRPDRTTTSKDNRNKEPTFVDKTFADSGINSDFCIGMNK